MKISLITVTYNSGATLRDTIESVLGQTYKDVEYIIVDGKSKDNTVQIIQEYEPRFNGNMKWISEKDSGLYDAMNKGIMMATGDVIGILNSDDFFTSAEILQNVSDNMSQQNIDAVYGDIHFVNSEDLKKTVRYYSSKSFSRGKMRLGFMPAHPSFYCRKSCFEKFGYYKLGYKIAADYELLLRMIYIHNISTLYLPADMVTMRTGGASTNGIRSNYNILKEKAQSFKDNGLHPYWPILILGTGIKAICHISNKIFKLR